VRIFHDNDASALGLGARAAERVRWIIAQSAFGVKVHVFDAAEHTCAEA
jgi:hypothetical protein